LFTTDKEVHRRTNIEKAVPINPENKENIKYNVPISLAFDDKNHLSNQRETTFILYILYI
jgi:hypothetical protein